MRISVAMAVYHGEAYLDAQLSSILSQLEPEDEIIVSDDCRTGRGQAGAVLAGGKSGGWRRPVDRGQRCR